MSARSWLLLTAIPLCIFGGGLVLLGPPDAWPLAVPLGLMALAATAHLLWGR